MLKEPNMIEELIKVIPPSIMDSLGGVFCSGRNAFSGKKDIYVIGLNPGGIPDAKHGVTVSQSIDRILDIPESNWSAYRDDSWEGAVPGTWGMQPRVLHMFDTLGLNPGEVPSSNLIFTQSRREKDIEVKWNALAEECWPFHSGIINKLGVKTIICFGKKAGRFVATKLLANTLVDEFIENNNRRWRSEAYISNDGLKVIIATHPSIVKWNSELADPCQMIKRVLA